MSEERLAGRAGKDQRLRALADAIAVSTGNPSIAIFACSALGEVDALVDRGGGEEHTRAARAGSEGAIMWN